MSESRGAASQAVPDRTVAIEAQTFVWVPLINFKIKSNQIDHLVFFLLTALSTCLLGGPISVFNSFAKYASNLQKLRKCESRKKKPKH